VGGNKYSGNRGTHKETKIPYESSLEKKFLDQCYLQGIRVSRCTDRIPFVDHKNHWHTYNPDFKLLDFDYAIEIKGAWAFKTNHGFVEEKYYAARRFFGGRYTIMTEKEIKDGFLSRLHAELVKIKNKTQTPKPLS